MVALAAGALAVLTLGACQQAGNYPAERSVPGGFSPDHPGWKSEVRRDHPLVGQLWKVSDNRFITASDFLRDLEDADFVLLGEKHDNEDHHRIQAWVVSELVARGRRPAFAFEMFDLDRQDALDVQMGSDPVNLEALAEDLSWEETGWPDWYNYRIILEAGLSAKAPVFAAGWPRKELRTIAGQGLGVLSPVQQAQFGLERDYDDDLRESLRLEVKESHCDQLPESMTEPMISITRLKDAFMAERLSHGLAQPGRDVAILIAGGGHVRNDFGVPWHLAERAKGARVVTLGILEVNEAGKDPSAYGQLFQDGGLPFEYVWFTPRLDELDPCEAYAEQLEKARQKHEEGQEQPSD